MINDILAILIYVFVVTFITAILSHLFGQYLATIAFATYSVTSICETIKNKK